MTLKVAAVTQCINSRDYIEALKDKDGREVWINQFYGRKFCG